MKPPQDNAPPKEVPTLREFVSRFIDGYARANRQKPSGVAAKEMILRVHLMPALGHKKLDAIKSEDVQHLKSRLSTKAAKTVNNILTVLNVLLKNREKSNRAARDKAVVQSQYHQEVLDNFSTKA